MVPSFALLCTLLPFTKDAFGGITSSSNYRAIASGNFLIRLLDLVVILLEGDKLDTEELQFGFQHNSSTTMCSWAVTSVVDYFNRYGSTVCAASLDLSKAFDYVEWEKLFALLKAKQLSPISIRVILHVYVHQKCQVSWNGKFSFTFSSSNGVRQGGIFLPSFHHILDLYLLFNAW